MLKAHFYRKEKKAEVPFEKSYAKWERFALRPGQWDLGVMLLAQHYGIPTNGIDITHDPNVALWFAVNRFSWVDTGLATYRQLAPSDWDTDCDKWPVIYVILPVTHSLNGSIRDVDLLDPLGIEALRPHQQKGAFFMGATGLHRNRLAEALVCIMRLAPGLWESGYAYTELFPSRDTDEMFDWMLKLKEKYARGDIGRFLGEVPDYKY
jgi:hypothetical protein